MYRGNCPICGEYLSERVYQDINRDFVEAVYLCEEHEVTVEWGEPIVTEVRDGKTGDRIPESEWNDTN